MRVAIASVRVPFINGGATIMRDELAGALERSGVKVDHISRPFRFGPATEVLRSMNEWTAGDADTFDCGLIDRVICLNFPSFYLKHSYKIAWIMHQHRAVYELYGTEFGADPSDPEWASLRKEITQRDTEALKNSKTVYTISQRVSDRLKHFNDLGSIPLYQPPAYADRYYCSDQLPYIFVPSRIETLKRQDLLLRALSNVRSGVAAIIVGEGGQRKNFERLAEDLGVASKVRFLGRVDQDEMRAMYANSLAVFFGPYDEDYGFVTLEAMLSSKPVITCTDSGGPLEFVVNENTGYVCEPDPGEIAERIDRLFANQQLAAEMGRAGYARYQSLKISWNNVLTHLLA